MTVDALVFAAASIAATTAVLAEQEDGQAVQGGQDARSGLIADTTVVFMVEDVTTVVHTAFYGPMAPAKVDEGPVRTTGRGPAAEQVQKALFFVPVVEIKTVTAQERQLPGEGETHIFAGDVHDLHLASFHSSALFVDLSG